MKLLKKKKVKKDISEVFEPDPYYFLFEDLGREIESACLSSKGNIFFVEGRRGMGKTSLARWLEITLPRDRVYTVVIEGDDISPLAEKIKGSLKQSFLRWLSSLTGGKSPTPKICVVVDNFHLAGKGETMKILHVLDVPFASINLVLLSSFSAKDLDSFDILSRYYVIEREMKLPSSDKLYNFVKEKLGGLGIPEEFLSLDNVQEACRRGKSVREVLQIVLKDFVASQKMRAGIYIGETKEEEHEELVRRIEEALER